MKKFCFALLLICVTTLTVTAQLNKAKLDSLFDILAAKNKAMGSVVLSKNGIILYTRTIGYSSISGNQKMQATAATKYRIGSISKMFTASMVFQLVEEGKLSLSTTIDKYFPTLPNAKKITIGNLLNHHSGLHNFTDDSTYRNWMTQPKTEQEMIDIIIKGGSDFEPGSKGKYSNSNYVVLGYVIEKICGKPYKDVLKERITSKLSLASTYCGGKTDINNNESFSYTRTDDWQQLPETDMSIPGGAGSIVSTPSDLAKFVQALFEGKIVSKTSLEQMKTIEDGYGMGLFKFPFGDKVAYGHTGGIDGFASSVSYFPSDSTILAFSSNGAGNVYPMNNVAIGVLSIYYNKSYTIPNFNTVSLKTEDLDKYLGTYTNTQLGAKLMITKDKTTLIAQAEGQSAFPMEATGKDQFKFDAAGIEIDFDTAKNQLTLLQGGGKFLFNKSK